MHETHSHTLTHSLTHTHSHSLTHTRNHSRSLTHNHSRSLKLTHAHSHSLTHSQFLLCCPNPKGPEQIGTRNVVNSACDSLSHTHSLTIAHTHSLTHSHTHTHSLTHSRSLTHARTVFVVLPESKGAGADWNQGCCKQCMRLGRLRGSRWTYA